MLQPPGGILFLLLLTGIASAQQDGRLKGLSLEELGNIEVTTASTNLQALTDAFPTLNQLLSQLIIIREKAGCFAA